MRTLFALVLLLASLALAGAQSITPTDPSQIPAPNTAVTPADITAIQSNTILAIERQVALDNQLTIQRYHDAVLANQQTNIARALHAQPEFPAPLPDAFPLCEVHVDTLWAIFRGAETSWSRTVTCDVVPPAWAPPAPVTQALGMPLPDIGFPGFYSVPGDNPSIVAGTIKTLYGYMYMKTTIPGMTSLTGPVTAWVKIGGAN